MWEWFIQRLLGRVIAQLETQMATLQDVKDLVASVAAGVDTLQAQIQALKDQLAAGTPVTQQDLDDLAASLAAVKADEDSTPA